MKLNDSTLARMAGNIAGAMVTTNLYSGPLHEAEVVKRAVRIARLILAEIERTEPTEAK
jgi:hypothetical protein